MNPTIAPPTLSPRAKIAATLALAALAVLGNLLNVPLFFGVTFIFGSVAVMLAIALLGTLPGLLVGIAGGLYTLTLFGHPYALLIFSAEALAVGLLHRKGVKNLVLADLAYWLAIGVPLVLLLYRGALGMGWTPATLIAFKQPLNGLFNALIAGLILLGLQLFWRGAKRLALATPRLADLLFHVLLTAVLLAGIVPTVHEGQNQLSQSEFFLANEMERTARQLARSFEANPQADPTLQLALLAEAHTVSGMDLALLANDGRALASRGKLESLAKPGSTQALTKGLEIWLPAGDMPIMKRWKQGHYQYRMPVPGMAAEILVAQPAAPLVGKLEQGHLTLFGFLTALLLLGTATSLALSRWLTGPLSALEAAGGRLTAQIADGIRPDFPHSSVREYDHLGKTLRDMTAQLADSFHELRRIQAGLEDQVQARTAELNARERALSDSKKLLDSVIENIPSMIFMKRADDLRFVMINKAGEDLLGYSRADLLDKNDFDFFPAEQADFFTEKDRMALAKGFEDIPEESIDTRTQGKRILHTRKIALRDEAGKAKYLLGISHDITESKQAEEALRQNRAQLAEAQRMAKVGSWSLDLASNRLEWSDEIFRIFEIDPSRFSASYQGFIDAIHPDDRQMVNEAYAESLAKRLPYAVTHRLLMADGRIKFVEEHGETLYAEDGAPLLSRGTVQDVTEHKLAERMKNEFVSTVSHELRTPLTSISGALGLINSGVLGQLPQQVAPMLDIAHKNSLRLTHLINDLLDLEKISAGKLHFDLQTQNLLPLLEQSMESNRAYGAERQVGLRLDCAESDIEIRVDGHRLQQVLSNLLSNAIKFSPDHGEVAVSVVRHGQRVRVAVADQGPGIPAAFRDRIFGQFAQADASDTRQKGGTGLGLAISKQLIERMGGEIGFESTEGQGSRFFFELPTSDRPAMPAAEGARTENGARILVVEDESDIAHLLRLMLEHAGYAVDIAHAGAEALAAIQGRHYAAITLDLMLPDIGGLEIIRRLRGRPETAELPIVVVSAKMEEGRLSLNGDFSGIEWLAKPIDEHRLIETIKQLTASAESRRPRVLHVEDDTDLHQVIRAMAGEAFDFEPAISLADARQRLAQASYDLVILDLALPDGSGWELLPDIRTRLPHARIVVLSGNDVNEDHARMVESVLLKSRMSQQELLDTLARCIETRKVRQ